MVAEAFSEAVITPGVTTTDDVVWWLRERIRGLGWTAWFHPSVGRQGAGDSPVGPSPGVIQYGDLLWTDVGVTAFGLATDTQHMGYVLAPGQVEVPAGLRQCLAHSNRMQDILLEAMEPGLTGNDILAAARAQVAAEGIQGTIYTHPIGDHGHGAGPLIGRWDAQEGVPVRGEAVLRPSTWHSIELQATLTIPEWGGKAARCQQEEEAWLDEVGERRWVFRRQTEFHLVRSP
jgi:Xaa-Pro aminopeptidase